MRYSLILSSIFAPCLLFSSSLSAQIVEKKDTLNRELVLEREFIPTGEKVTKQYFNPLDLKENIQLTPLSFVKNDYTLGLNVRPRLFDPLYVDHAPDFSSRTWYLKAFGGYPGYLGVSTGWHINATETGALDLLLDHLTETVRLRDKAIGIDKHLKRHNTEVTGRYTQTLEDGLLIITGQGYYDLNSVYGHPSDMNPLEDQIAPQYPLMAIRGGGVEISKTPARLMWASPWTYDAMVSLRYGSKDDLPYETKPGEELYPTGTSLDLSKPITTTQLALRATANLAYHFSDFWGFGAGFRGQYNIVSSKATVGTDKGPFVLAAAPHITVNYDSFKGYLGAQIQFLNQGDRKMVAVPDVDLRWIVAPTVSFSLKVDGGASLYDMREVYKLNPYFQGSSLYSAMDLAQVRAMIGADLGDFRGFSIGVKGGWTRYDLFNDWQTLYFLSSMEGHEVPTTYFALRRRKDVGHTFLRLHSSFVSPYGFHLGAQLQLNQYSLLKKDSDKDVNEPEIMGLPKMELKAFADYRVTPQLSVRADLLGIGSSTFTNMKGEKVTPKWVTELNVGAHYRINDTFGASLTALNLLSSSNTRWLNYQRPGIGVMGAVTVNL